MNTRAGWVRRTEQGMAALLLLLVLGACEQLGSAPDVELSPAAVTLNRPIYITPAYNASAAVTVSYSRRDSTGKTYAGGTWRINNSSGIRRASLQYKGGDGVWRFVQYYINPGINSTTYNWSTSGPARTYYWRVCGYVPSSGSYVWSCPQTPTRVSLD